MTQILPLRIVLFGVRSSGKDTCGNWIHEAFGHRRCSLAGPIKVALKSIFGFSDADLYGPSKNRETQYPEFPTEGWCFSCNAPCVYDPAHNDEPDRDPEPWFCTNCRTRYPRYVSPRHALQTLGTEWGRRLCNDLWANSLFANNNGAIVVTDGRFENESLAARRNGCVRILLTRGLAESRDAHPSEAEVRDLARAVDSRYFDFVLRNNDMDLTDTQQALLHWLANAHRQQPQIVHATWVKTEKAV